MITPDILAEQYTLTYTNIQRQIDGLTHADSVLQLPFGGNCLNWTLGHITVTRWNVLAMAGDPDVQQVWNFGEARRYIPGSAPITRSEDAVPFETLVAVFDRTQERLLAILRTMTLSNLDKPVENATLGARLSFYHTHEAYHAGQLEIYRRLAGKTDAIDFE